MKLLHLSDLHLGKRVNGFSMLEDQRVILTQIVDLAEEEKVDAVLLAGDLYDKRSACRGSDLWTGSSLGYPAEGFLFLPSLETMTVRSGWPLPPGS